MTKFPPYPPRSTAKTYQGSDGPDVPLRLLVKNDMEATIKLVHELEARIAELEELLKDVTLRYADKDWALLEESEKLIERLKVLCPEFKPEDKHSEEG
jgi:hypothetical protein